MMVRFGQIGRPVPATFVSVTSARVKSPLPPREGRECAQFNSASRSPCISVHLRRSARAPSSRLRGASPWRHAGHCARR
jgi:hypothetical protein